MYIRKRMKLADSLNVFVLFGNCAKLSRNFIYLQSLPNKIFQKSEKDFKILDDFG